jgi:hypothetical protein
MRLDLPIKIESLQNMSHHWRVRHHLARSQRHAVYYAMVSVRPAIPPLPVHVKLTRIAPRPLDAHDNLRIGWKAIVDVIAEWYGIKDNDPRISFEYKQERGEPKTYEARIEFMVPRGTDHKEVA